MNTSMIVGLVFSVFCCWMLLHALRNLRNASASSKWPSVRGQMTKVDLWGMRNVGGEQIPVEKISVKYEYRLKDKRYTGTQISFFTLVYPATVVFAKDHPESAEVPVFYNPDKPEESVLVVGKNKGNKAYSDVILAGIGLLVSAGVLARELLGLAL